MSHTWNICSYFGNTAWRGHEGSNRGPPEALFTRIRRGAWLRRFSKQKVLTDSIRLNVSKTISIHAFVQMSQLEAFLLDQRFLNFESNSETCFMYLDRFLSNLDPFCRFLQRFWCVSFQSVADGWRREVNQLNRSRTSRFRENRCSAKTKISRFQILKCFSWPEFDGDNSLSGDSFWREKGSARISIERSAPRRGFRYQCWKSVREDEVHLCLWYQVSIPS